MERQDTPQTNPWLGLQTYKEGEILYGRSEEIRILSGLVLRNTQTVVFGRSGIGKSSILNAGVFPVVRRHGVVPVSVRLDHSGDMASYLRQIKAAVKKAFESLEKEGKVTETELAPASEEETLWEYFHRIEHRDADGRIVRPLVVLDQFEEIFTLQSDRRVRDSFFSQLADLINNVMPEGLSDSLKSENPTSEGDYEDVGEGLDLGLDSLSTADSLYLQGSEFHLVFTLREDFLSALERNTTDIPELRNNRYSLQPINEEQAAEIIMRPRPGLISTEVARLIISRVTGENDFELDGIPEIQVDSAILSLYLSCIYNKMVEEGEHSVSRKLVETYGDNIIEEFYTEAISGLPESTVEYLEDTLINEDGRRDNRSKKTVMREGHLSDSEIERLTDKVKLLRQFSYGKELRIEFIHDVLCPVIVKRRTGRAEEKRIAAITEAAARERRKARKNILIVSAIAVGVAATAIGIYLWNQYQNVWTVEEAYPAYETQDGWPVGIGPRMSAEEMSRTPRYYILSKKGHSAPHFTTVRVGSSNEIPPESPMHTPFELLNKEFMTFNTCLDTLLNNSRSIEFIPNIDGKIDYMAFLDSKGAVLFNAKSYIGDKFMTFSFTSPDGNALTIDENGTDRVRVSLDSLGFVSSISYYDAQGVRREHSVYGYNKTVDKDAGSIEVLALDEFNLPYSSRGINGFKMTYLGADTWEEELFTASDGNASERRIGGRWLYKPGETEFYDGDGTLCKRMTYEKDAHGNILVAKTEVMKSNPGEENNIRNYTYDPKGRMIEELLRNANGDTLEIKHRSYDENDRLVYREDRHDNVLDYLYRINSTANTVTTEIAGSEYSCVTKDSTFNDGTRSVTYYTIDGEPKNENGIEYQAIHRKIIRELPDNAKEISYYIYDEGLIRPVPRAEGIFRELIRYDSEGNAVSSEAFDPDGEVIHSMMYFYRNGQCIGRAAMGIDGTPVRCPDWEIENFGYYKMYFNRDNSGEYTQLRSVNETGKPSTLFWKEYNDYFTASYINLRDCSVTPEGTPEIPFFKNTFIQKDYSQFTAMKPRNLGGERRFAHLLDRENPLYRAGLRDGDIIVSPMELRGAQAIETIAFRNGKYSRRTISLAAPLTPADLRSLHIHPLRITVEEEDNLKQSLAK